MLAELEWRPCGADIAPPERQRFDCCWRALKFQPLFSIVGGWLDLAPVKLSRPD